MDGEQKPLTRSELTFRMRVNVHDMIVRICFGERRSQGGGGVGVATGQIVGFSRCLALPTFSRYGACVYVCVRVRACDSVCND